MAVTKVLLAMNPKAHEVKEQIVKLKLQPLNYLMYSLT